MLHALSENLLRMTASDPAAGRERSIAMVSTPIYDFISSYVSSSPARFHVPGHKGAALLGPEPLDLTEVAGADDLYAPDGIIADSQRNAAALFGTAATFYSAEGSSLCIRAMLHLLLTHRPAGTPRRILAARNVHRSFISAAALLDADVSWLYPETMGSPLSCLIPPDALDRALTELCEPPAAVYVTSPDYLGSMQDISALAEVCHRHGSLLAVDNAHGAYLHFLPEPQHPLDLGADICCDSAHKTLPVLTGGAYLHLSGRCPAAMIDDGPSALSLFGSSSPSYLILTSLDLANAALASGLPDQLRQTRDLTESTKAALMKAGWLVHLSDPLRITLRTDGAAVAARLRAGGVEPEYADPDHVVLMVSPGNTAKDHFAMRDALGQAVLPPSSALTQMVRGMPVLTMRQALLGRRQNVRIEDAVGRVCADVSAACPPAVPPVMPGERISEEHVILFRHYGIGAVSVVP